MLEYNLPPAPPAPSLARDVVRSVVPPLSDAAAHSVLLMTSEIVSNALRHGRPQASQEVALRVDRRPHNVRVEVLNDGPAFVPERPDKPTEARDSGYGLYLVDRLSTAWGVEAEGERTKVWFELDDDADGPSGSG
jgi:signal transduction histidine kinase